MKYRILGLLGVMALTAGSLQAQDYDDIYYDASKAQPTTKTKVKVEKPAKTVAVYGDVPERYKLVVKDNYREERDVDEYNRRGAYEPKYEVDINGDTIYFDGDSVMYDDDMFANTRRIERFYNPDIVILSDDDDLVELYYDESPTINLIVGSDWAYSSYGWSSSYYPWYTGWYEPWYSDWYSPWYYGWYSPWRYGWYSPVYFGYWHSPYYGWWGHHWHNHWGWGPHYNDWGWSNTHYDWTTHRPNRPHTNVGGSSVGRRAGLASNRNGRGRVDATGGRNSVSARRTSRSGSASAGMGGNRNRSGMASSRSGNMGSRNNSGITTRSGGASSRGSYSGGRSSSGGSYSSGSSSRSGGSYSSGSSSRSGGSYSSGSSGSSRSGGSYSSGSSHSSGGGSHGGSSGGGGRRR